MTGSTREQEPNLHEVRETSVLTLYGVSTYTFAVAPSRARGLKCLGREKATHDGQESQGEEAK